MGEGKSHRLVLPENLLQWSQRCRKMPSATNSGPAHARGSSPLPSHPPRATRRREVARHAARAELARARAAEREELDLARRLEQEAPPCLWLRIGWTCNSFFGKHWQHFWPTFGEIVARCSARLRTKFVEFVHRFVIKLRQNFGLKNLLRSVF